MDVQGRQLSVNPSIIDYGCLQPGVGARVIIRIEGGPAKVTANTERIQVTPSEVGEETTDIEVIINDGPAGDLIWDTLHVQGDKGELDIPVICWWDETLSQRPMPTADAKETVKPAVSEQQKDQALSDDVPVKREVESANSLVVERTVVAGASGRTYIAKSCPYCGRNLRYNSDNGTWLKCDKCKGARIIISVPQRAISETRLGIKTDGKKVLRDLWEVIIGKQDWNLK